MDVVTGIPRVGLKKISAVLTLNELETRLASNYLVVTKTTLKTTAYPRRPFNNRAARTISRSVPAVRLKLRIFSGRLIRVLTTVRA
jgi:hypothetical protein